MSKMTILFAVMVFFIVCFPAYSQASDAIIPGDFDIILREVCA